MQVCFVRQESLQLVKRPAMEIGSLLAPKLHTLTDAAQILNGDTAPGAFRKVYDRFADPVILIRCVTLFFLGKVFQYTLGRFRTFALQATTLAATTLAQIEHDRTIMAVAVTIKGDVDDATVNAKPLVGIEAFWLWNVAGLMDVVFTFAVNQIGLALGILQQVNLLLSRKVRHFDSAVDSPKTNYLIWFPAKDSTVIDHTAERGKGAFRFPVEFVTVRNLGDYTNGHLRRKVELLTNGVVSSVVQIVLLETFCHPSLVTDKLRSTIRREKRSSQRFSVLFGYV